MTRTDDTCNIHQKSPSRRTAAIVHVFYSDAWPGLETAIKNIVACDMAGSVDVFITYPETKPEWRIMLADTFPRARIEPVANRGWDGWPFIKFLNEIDLRTYDYIVKLHSKRDVSEFWVNFHRFRGNAWRRELLSFCSTPAAARRTFTAFANQPLLGMVASERMIDPICGGTWKPKDVERQENLLRGLGLEPREKTVVYGTMFAMRASLLMPLWRQYVEEDFVGVQSENPHADYGLAGDLEIMFGLLVRAQGCYVSSGYLPAWAVPLFYSLKGGLFRVARFLSDVLRHLTKKRLA